MITRSDQDWTTLNLAALQALQLSARKTLVDIAPYLERLHSERHDLETFQLNGLLFYAAELTEGVLVDPALPAELEEQDTQSYAEAQISRWWQRPFIERNTWEGAYGLEVRHRAGQAALRQVFPELAKRDVEKHIAALKELWFGDWPMGVRYEVRCFDRSSPSGLTSWGTFASMPEALNCALGGGRW